MTTAFPLGFFGYSNPDGNNEAAFNAGYSSFAAAMGGAHPKFVDTFVDPNIDPSQWGTNAGWTAWSLASTGSSEVGPGSGTIPVVGMPMATNSTGWSNVDAFLKGIIGGKYDASYKAVIDQFAANGYKTIEARLGYEFNANFMAWSPNNSGVSTADADFVAAWRHLANLVHAEGVKDGITVKTVWNPDTINWTPNDVRALYPGNKYVDVMGADVYSPTYPNDLTNWSTGGTTQMTDPTAWASVAANREHYWMYQNANQWNPQPGLTYGSGWSMNDAIQFAEIHHKPLAISETGAGGNGTTTGPVDDGAFPGWLANALSTAQTHGLVVDSVNIWDASPSDGHWHFSGGAKPMEAAAWNHFFGARSTVSAAQLSSVLTWSQHLSFA